MDRTLRRRVLPVAVVILTAVAGAVSGRPAFAEVVGGLGIVWVSVLIGSAVTDRVEGETSPHRLLAFDLLLLLVVLLGLAGLTLIGLALSQGQ